MSARDWSPAMNEALQLAREAENEGEVPVGAVVVEDSTGRILGRGRNCRETQSDPVGHAEILALQQAAKTLQSWRLTGCTLVVTLEPCAMCLAAAQLARVNALVYSARDPKGGALSLGYLLHQDQRLNHRFEVDRLDLPSCGEILSEFFRRKRKKPL